MAEAKKFMAASVPRFVRLKRLGYLPNDVVIGSWHSKDDFGRLFVYDVIMLPPDLFNRAKGYLALPGTATPTLEMVNFDPPYVLKDIKEVTVPSDEVYPEIFAKAYLRNEFKIADASD